MSTTSPIYSVSGYDGSGNLLSISYPKGASFNEEFEYDSQNRLQSADVPTGTFSWTYDKVGNRLSQTVGEAIDTYSYLASTNKLAQIDGANPASYSYDPAGNIIAEGTRTLVYNQDNRLIQVSDSGNVLGQYVYNAFGQRVKKTTGGAATIFLYDFDGNLIAENPGSPSSAVEYLYFGKNCIAQADASGNVYFHYNDRLGQPKLIVNQNNEAVWRADYKPFGEAVVNAYSSVANNMRFPGQYYDSETGYHYNWNRYYDPKIGRYLTADPIGLLVGGMNPYIYVANDPINSMDPGGLRLCRINLPGLGDTYIDEAFSPMVRAWLDANQASGIDVTATSAFRTIEEQQHQRRNSRARTPAAISLHEAGFAVDIDWSHLNEQQRNTTVQNAQNAGLSWGGNFSTPDPIHFYYDPGNRDDRIWEAQQQFQQTIICDDCPY